ncbi:MAG TPA: hypothetical protein VI248_25985 [Kineosporiaceae bacterium]
MSAVWLERQTAKPPLTLNVGRQRGEWARRKELAEWRKWAKEYAEGIDPIAGPVAVTAVHLRKTHASMPDVGAPILAVKAVIDGLVDAHVLPGDGPDIVQSLLFEQPLIVGYHGLRVIVRPIEQHAGRSQQPPITGSLTLPSSS